MKGFSSKRRALKADALEDWKIYCLQARLCIFQPGNFTLKIEAGAVKGYINLNIAEPSEV